MLGSAHEGERAVAALKATKILKDLGLSWEVVITRGLAVANSAAPGQPEMTPEPARPKDNETWHNRYRARQQQQPKPERRRTRNGWTAWQAWNYLDCRRAFLTEWENDFLNSMASKGPALALTDKQWAVVENMLHKVSSRAA